MRLETQFLSGALLAAGFATALAAGVAAPVRAQNGVTMQTASDGVTLAIGRGTLVRMPRPMADVFVANEKIANVQVRSPNALYVFGVGAGETTVYATDKAGSVIWSTNVRVGSNYDQLRSMISLAMPDSKIEVTPMNGAILLTGTVAAPDEVEEANRMVKAFVGEETPLFNKLRTATPLQVALKVRIAEVNRDLMKEVGVNLLTRDNTGGFLFGLSRGRNFGSIGDVDLSGLPKLDASSVFGLPAGSLSLPFDTRTGQFVTGGTAFNFSDFADGQTTLKFAGKLFGLDIASALDLAEQEGAVTTLAEPTLTALSGETASFLAGGEIPVPIAQGLGTVSVEY
jgi:pilus assembly protein CpaC